MSPEEIDQAKDRLKAAESKQPEAVMPVESEEEHQYRLDRLCRFMLYIEDWNQRHSTLVEEFRGLTHNPPDGNGGTK